MTSHDLENARNEAGELTQDSIEHWIMLHSGDFQEIIAWEADIEDGEVTRLFCTPNWENDQEHTWVDCMSPVED
jgi:hypothetical protein